MKELLRTKIFPLFSREQFPATYMDGVAQNAVKEICEQIAKQQLHLIPNHCLCGNDDTEHDIIVSEVDRYGFPIPMVLCSKCGLIRSGLCFDEKSNNEFYTKYYRSIYNSGVDAEKYFMGQTTRGQKFYNLLESLSILDNIKSAAEIGCGAGGVILPFHKHDISITGYDLDDNYLSVGRQHGLNLINGDFFEFAEDESLDLVILSHVFEHFGKPLESLSLILSKIQNGGYILFEVPGLYWHPDKFSWNPIAFFQNAHVIQYFYKDWLKVMFESFGLEILYGDERCTFVCRKTKGSTHIHHSIFDRILSAYPQRNIDYLRTCWKQYKKESKQRNYIYLLKVKLYSLYMRFMRWKKIKPHLIE